MYKVEYYTLGISKVERKVGNIKQYTDVYYTDSKIDSIENNLISILDAKNYFPVITNINKIKGHL